MCKAAESGCVVLAAVSRSARFGGIAKVCIPSAFIQTQSSQNTATSVRRDSSKLKNSTLTPLLQPGVIPEDITDSS